MLRLPWTRIPCSLPSFGHRNSSLPTSPCRPSTSHLKHCSCTSQRLNSQDSLMWASECSSTKYQKHKCGDSENPPENVDERTGVVQHLLLRSSHTFRVTSSLVPSFFPLPIYIWTMGQFKQRTCKTWANWQSYLDHDLVEHGLEAEGRTAFLWIEAFKTI